MALYEIRAKLKQQDSTSLMKVRDKIAALQARQGQNDKKDGGDAAKSNVYSYPKAS
jgi:hypothetical protein